MRNGILAAAVALATCGTATAGDWQWSITPYLWATDVGMDVTVRDRSVVETTIPFDDLLEDVDWVLQLRAQAMQGENGVAVDLFDVVMSDEAQLAMPGGTGGELAVDARIGMTILDLAGVHDPGADGEGFSLLYGVRLINQREDLDLALTGVEPPASQRFEANDTYVDALAGLRYTARFSPHWSLTLNSDISTGGTELSWSLSPTLGYRFGKRENFQVIAGYRYLAVDFRTDPEVDLDMTLSGFLTGFRFTF